MRCYGKGLAPQVPRAAGRVSGDSATRQEGMAPVTIALRRGGGLSPHVRLCISIQFMYTYVMSNILQRLPVGERVGIAFSGGLDTCAALHWMRQRGSIPYRLYRPPRPARRDRLRRDPAQGDHLRRRAGAAHRVPGPAGGRGHRRAPVRRVPHLHGRASSTSTPRRSGRAVTGTMLVSAMQEDEVNVWGDGSTYKGNDIERFYRYGLLVNPHAAHLQALARSATSSRNSAGAPRCPPTSRAPASSTR